MKHFKRPVPPIGTRIYAWTVVGELIRAEKPEDNRLPCQCDCGTIKNVLFYSLMYNRSFRCLRCTRRLMNPNWKHGAGRPRARTPEFQCWVLIKRRCFDSNSREYVNYGGRGIGMDPAWRTSFSAFLHAVGPKPPSAHSIDRIDNNRGYEPGNVRWATLEQQANNRRNNRYITHEGITQSVADWARYFGIRRILLYRRLKRHRWNLDLVCALFHIERRSNQLPGNF